MLRDKSSCLRSALSRQVSVNSGELELLMAMVCLEWLDRVGRSGSPIARAVSTAQLSPSTSTVVATQAIGNVSGGSAGRQQMSFEVGVP